MHDDEILTKLISIMNSVSAIDHTGITLSADIIFDLGISSVEVVGLLLGVEDEFDIEIGAERAFEARTVEKFIKLISSSLKQKTSANGQIHCA